MGLLTGRDGRRWYAGGARVKRVRAKRHCETIDETWREAFIQSAIYGEVMTSYRCLLDKSTRSEVRTAPHPTLSAFRPWLSRMVKRDLRQRRCWANAT